MTYLLKLSRVFDPLGHEDSGFYMTMRGIGPANHFRQITFELVARHRDGLFIPSMPAILLAKKLARSEMVARGACPCLGLISFDEYLSGLSEFNIKWQVIRQL